jgi:hypothetical protein
MGLFKKKPNAQKISDKLGKLASDARFGNNEAAIEVNQMLLSINDINFLNEVYNAPKDLNHMQVIQDLVIQRFHEIINEITDIHELNKIKGNINFTGATLRRLEILISQSEDDQQLQEVLKNENEFHWSIKNLAKFKLSCKNMSDKRLLDIINKKDKELQSSGSGLLECMAVGCLNDIKTLNELAFNQYNLWTIMMRAQIKLIEISEDIELLEKIKKFNNDNIHGEPTIIVINEMADARIDELKRS